MALRLTEAETRALEELNDQLNRSLVATPTQARIEEVIHIPEDPEGSTLTRISAISLPNNLRISRITANIPATEPLT